MSRAKKGADKLKELNDALVPSPPPADADKDGTVESHNAGTESSTNDTGESDVMFDATNDFEPDNSVDAKAGGNNEPARTAAEDADPQSSAWQPVQYAPALQHPKAQALHSAAHSFVDNTMMGFREATVPLKRTRGKDKKPRTRRCGRCRDFKGEYVFECGGNAGNRDKCQYFDVDGTRRCKKCKTFGESGEHPSAPYECAATKGHKNECEYFDEEGEPHT